MQILWIQVVSHQHIRHQHTVKIQAVREKNVLWYAEKYCRHGKAIFDGKWKFHTKKKLPDSSDCRFLRSIHTLISRYCRLNLE